MSALSGLVQSAADTLRGPYTEAEYVSVILPFTVLRRAECVMEPHREVMAEILRKYPDEHDRLTYLKLRTKTPGNAGLNFWTTSDYTLTRALTDPDRLPRLIDYASGFSAHFDVFGFFGFEHVLRTLEDRNRLVPVIRHFHDIDLSPQKVSNADMGDLFENLIYRFTESANGGAGQFYTRRDVVRLLVELVCTGDGEALRQHGGEVPAILDPAAGTGSMLTVAGEHLNRLSMGAPAELFGQEINPRTYAICKADLLIKGQSPGNVRLGNTLVNDTFKDRKFHYVLSNPPFGTDWKAVASEVTAEHNLKEHGRFAPGLPGTGDASMLFLLHAVSKMRPADSGGPGGRAGIVLNGSPLFTGAADSGPSRIRGYLLENDLVEAIIALPSGMFYNTGIATYLWILSNATPDGRKGTVQLIDATGMGTRLRKPAGSKHVEVSARRREDIVRAFTSRETSAT